MADLATLAGTLADPPALAVLEGEAGIGKTRLVGELRAAPALSGRRFVVGCCQPIREPFPLGPVIEAWNELGDAIAEPHRPGRSGLSPVAGALAALLPELAPRLPPPPAPLDDPMAEQHRVFRALVEVLAAAGPTVLVLEDLHWADERTVDFAGYLAGRLPEGVSLLVTFRTDGIDPRLPSLAIEPPAATGPRPASRARVALAPLSVDQTGELAAAVLGLERAPHELASFLCERAAGLPFAIEELLALLVDGPAPVPQAGSGGWDGRRLGELAVPPGIRDQVLVRVGRLTADARAVVEAAAVLQSPAPLPVVVATCRVAEAEALRGLEEALAAGLVVEQDSGIGCRHPLAAEAIYRAVPAPRRQVLHQRAADALARLDPHRLGRRAHHLRHAGELEKWVEVTQAAADQAAANGHNDDAARLLAELLAQAPATAFTAEARGRLAVRLASVAIHALHPRRELLDLLASALTPALPPPVRGELRLRMALLLERFGADYARMRALCEEAVTDLGDRPDLRANAMVALASPSVPGIPLADRRRWLHRIRRTVPAIRDPAFQVGVLGKVAMVQLQIGDPQWREVTDGIVARVVAHTGGLPRDRAELNAYYSVGSGACYAGHLDVASRLVAAGLAAAAATGSWQHELWLRATWALLDYCRGTWDGLGDRTGILINQLEAEWPPLAEAEVAAGCLALASGDPAGAAGRLDHVITRLERTGGYDLLPVPVGARIRLAVGRGESRRAATEAQRFVAATESVPLLTSFARILPVLAEALAADGQQPEAHRLVRRWSGQLAGRDAPLAPAAVPHARGVVAAATGRGPAAAEDLLAAADRYDRMGCRYEAAQAREQAATALLRTGGDGDAGARAGELRTAMIGFQRLGATWDFDRASATARRYGVPVPPRHRRGRKGYGSELSPREREVADLAARGHTNREIAAELFVSVKTVEQHIGTVMRKLAVSSRRGIGRRLGETINTGSFPDSSAPEAAPGSVHDPS